jgi:hypothetical protein
MQEFWQWTSDVLVQWNQDANRITSENPWFMVAVIALLVAFFVYPVGRFFWLYIRWMCHRFIHWGRKSVGRHIADHRAREYFADGVINLVNYMWLTGMITRKKRNNYFVRLAKVLDEPDFLPPKPAKPLSKDAQNHKKKLLLEGNGKLVGPASQLPGDKPEQNPKEATRKSMPKKGRVVEFS